MTLAVADIVTIEWKEEYSIAASKTKFSDAGDYVLFIVGLGDLSDALCSQIYDLHDAPRNQLGADLPD